MKTLKYAWRFLMRSKSYTIINLLGLAFSLACSIILMRYIHRELTVDTHCIDREHVYAIDIFIISLLLVIIISLGTLAYQIQKAAYINPTQIMKTE